MLLIAWLHSFSRVQDKTKLPCSAVLIAPNSWHILLFFNVQWKTFHKLTIWFKQLKISDHALLSFSIKKEIKRTSLYETKTLICYNYLKVRYKNKLGKVYLFWVGHKILQNLHLTFEWHYIGQKLGEDFAKLSSLLRIYELYITLLRFSWVDHVDWGDNKG